MKKNKIKFTFVSEYGWGIEAARPVPAHTKIPSWFKNMDQYDDKEGIKLTNRTSNATAKKCTPMMDSMVSGYILSLWADVLVKTDNDLADISWKVTKDVFSLHGPSSRMIPSPPGYDQVVFKYNSMLTARTPKGYSILVTSPMGHNDLPFKAISAIIDTDKPNIDLAFPVWLKSGFNGIVEKGTPIVQIIPFKRDSWESEFDYMTEDEYSVYIDNGFESKIKNHYIRNIWSKKEFR